MFEIFINILSNQIPTHQQGDVVASSNGRSGPLGMLVPTGSWGCVRMHCQKWTRRTVGFC